MIRCMCSDIAYYTHIGMCWCVSIYFGIWLILFCLSYLIYSMDLSRASRLDWSCSMCRICLFDLSRFCFQWFGAFALILSFQLCSFTSTLLSLQRYSWPILQCQDRPSIHSVAKHNRATISRALPRACQNTRGFLIFATLINLSCSCCSWSCVGLVWSCC